MTPSTHTSAQCGLDFHVVEIDSVTSSAADGCAYNALSGDLSSAKSMFDVVATRCSYGTKNGLNHVLDGNLTATLTDVLNSRTAVPFQNGVLHHTTDDITRNDGHSPSVSINRSACDNDADDGSADDVSVDVVSGTSGDLSSIHRSLCQNAQGNYDLDDASPVEPFVQELVQWKKTRTRSKKSQLGGPVQFAPSNNKRKRAQSVSRSKKQKTSLVEELGANTVGSADLFGVSRCLIAPSIVAERFVHTVPEVPHTNTLSSIVELCSNSLTTVYKDVKNVAISRLKVGSESLLMTNHGTSTPVRQTYASTTPSALASTPNPAILRQLTSQQPRPSLASANESLKVDANGIIDISKANESSMTSAGAQEETSRGNEAACTNVIMFDDEVEVVDLELEESDVDEGEELLLADTGADLASAVQFVELRPDDVFGDEGKSVEVDELPGEEQTIAGGTDVSHLSDEVFGRDGCQLTELERPAGDGDVGDGGSKREGCELRSFDGGANAEKGLTHSIGGRERTLHGQNSAASKKRVRRKRVIKYHATALTSEKSTKEELDDRLKGNYLHENLVEESRLKWQKLLQGNNFNEREPGVVSRVKQFQDCHLSTTRDNLRMEGLRDGNAPVVQCKVLPLEHCKELSSNSVTHLIKRGKHWFKKILPPPSTILKELECASHEEPDNCQTDSLPPSHTVSQSGKPCKNIPLETPPSSGYILYIADPIVPSPAVPTSTADGPASREDKGLSWTSLRGAVEEGSSRHSPSFTLSQDHPEVQFVAMEDVTEIGDDSFHDAASLADDCDPLGGDAEEDPFSGLRTVDACRDPDDAVGSDGSLRKYRIVKFAPREDFSDSGLGNSIDSNSFNPRITHIKSEYTGERSSPVNASASVDERIKSSSSINASLGNEIDAPLGGTIIRCPPPPSEEVEPLPPPGVTVRQYNLTSDAIHFHQSVQMIMDPMMVHRIQHDGESRLPGVCDAEDFILRKFSSNNYVFIEVDPNTSRLPQGLHRFNLQVKGNRVYRSSKPRLTFRIQAASCDDTASGALVEGAADGNGGTSSTCSGGLTDDESTSSYPRLSSSGSLVMRNPHADLKRYLLANDRLQNLFMGLQKIKQNEKDARLAAHSSSNGPPSPAHAETLQDLYSKRVHMQVHFHRVLHYLKVTWFREKIREANCKAAENNSSTSQHVT